MSRVEIVSCARCNGGDDESKPEIVIGYWAIRGLVQSIRLLLEYAGARYEEKRYFCGPAPDYDRSCWMNEKFELGLELPNLPYMFDGEFSLSQTDAILRYLAQKFDLLGDANDIQFAGRLNMAVGALGDLRTQFTRLSYNPDFESLKPNFVEVTLPAHLGMINKFIGDSEYMLGKSITYVDFVAYDLLDSLRELSAETVAQYPSIVAFLDRIEALPAIQAYLNSDRFIRHPINNIMAKFQ